MAWNYTGNPASSNMDAVRFLIHDTDPGDQKLQDEEINWLLTEEGQNVYRAAAMACMRLAAIYANMASGTSTS